MAIAYGAAGGNAVQAQIRYREQFPEGLYLVQKRPKRLWQRSFPVRGLTKINVAEGTGVYHALTTTFSAFTVNMVC
jgi:hypothetical protein